MLHNYLLVTETGIFFISYVMSVLLKKLIQSKQLSLYKYRYIVRFIFIVLIMLTEMWTGYSEAPKSYQTCRRRQIQV